jgi:hypothetical protein
MDIYLSYAWNDSGGFDVEENTTFIEQLAGALTTQGWNVRQDTTEVNYRDSVKEFMQDLGMAKYVIVVVSNKYLHSYYCMYEVKEILKHRQWQQRIYPIVLNDAKVFKGEGFAYTSFWQTELERLGKEIDPIRGTHAGITGLQREDELRQIANASGPFIAWLGEACQLSAQEHLTGRFTTLLASLTPEPIPPSSPKPNLKWPEVNIRTLDFSRALRPRACSELAYQLLVERRSSNLIGPIEQGRRRMIDDLVNCGLQEQGIRPILINMRNYVKSFQGFIEDLQAQTGAAGKRLIEILENAAQQSGQCNLLILDNFEAILQEPDGLDAQYNIPFLNSLNALRNTTHTRLLLGSTRPHNDGAYQYQGRSSWLDLREFWLPDLELSEIKAEIDARWSQVLSEILRDTLSEHIYTEINYPYPLLEAVCRQAPQIWQNQPLHQLRELKKKLSHA